MSRKKATRAKRAKRGTPGRAKAARRGAKAARRGAGVNRATKKQAGGATAKRKPAIKARKRAVASKRGLAAKGAAAAGPRSAKLRASGRPKLALVKTGARPAAGARSRPAPKLEALTLTKALGRGRPRAPKATFALASKAQVMFSLMRSRAQVLNVLRGIDAVQAERPIAKGKWCVREIVLHLALRDRARLSELESTLRGLPSTWMGYTVEDWKRLNREELGTVERLDWAEALELLNETRGELLDALESVPEEPADVWSELHTFGSMLMGLPPHDAHHGEQIRRWREERGI